jgi:hypothetical protein
MRLNTPAVRDLAWVIGSPVLLDGCYQNAHPVTGNADVIIDDAWCGQQFSKHLDWLRALDESPQVLLDWLKPRQNKRLGYYFESLVEYWLRHEYHAGRLVSHLPITRTSVYGGQRTLGEFDFLLEDAEGRQIQHWEVAVKFYLQYRQGDGGVVWYGPNSRDRLEIKLHKLFHHQLTLSRQPPASAALRDMGLISPVIPRLLLKGVLFYRSRGDWTHAESYFPGLSALHLRGWWTFLEPLEIPNATSTQSRWFSVPRLQWLAPAKISRGGENQLMNYRDLHNYCLNQLQGYRNPPLLAEMRLMDSGNWEEVSRGFVVPQQWPG